MKESKDRSDMERSREARDETAPGKRPYTPPRLTDYGRIHSLTLGLSGQGDSEEPDTP